MEPIKGGYRIKLAMKMIDMCILTLPFGLVSTNLLHKVLCLAPLWWINIFRIFVCFIWRFDATKGYRFIFGLGSRYVGHSSVLIRELSADSTQFGVIWDLIWSWIGVRSADIWPTNNLSKTGQTVYHRWPNEDRHVAERSPTKPTPHRYITDRQPTICRGETFQTCLKDLSSTNVSART